MQLQFGAGAPISNPMDKPTPRATKRPADFTQPAHWTNEPAPKPMAIERGDDPDGLDPTRFGDWEKNGIAIDF
ncbi:Protein of unknown function [Novosphingobium sp. B1]|nr:Protein of unknown function [Novosphingobium sp. B1]